MTARAQVDAGHIVYAGARMFFQSSVPGGHENYFHELAELLAESGGQPSAEASEELRRRWHIEQLTRIRGGRS